MQAFMFSFFPAGTGGAGGLVVCSTKSWKHFQAHCLAMRRQDLIQLICEDVSLHHIWGSLLKNQQYIFFAYLYGYFTTRNIQDIPVISLRTHTHM